MTLKLFFCVLFITCCFTVTLAWVPKGCCTPVKNFQIIADDVVNFYDRGKEQGCSIDATILETQDSKYLCVPANKHWVRKVKAHVNCKKQHKKPSNHC